MDNNSSHSAASCPKPHDDERKQGQAGKRMSQGCQRINQAFEHLRPGGKKGQSHSQPSAYGQGHPNHTHRIKALPYQVPVDHAVIDCHDHLFHRRKQQGRYMQQLYTPLPKDQEQKDPSQAFHPFHSHMHFKTPFPGMFNPADFIIPSIIHIPHCQTPTDPLACPF